MKKQMVFVPFMLFMASQAFGQFSLHKAREKLKKMNPTKSYYAKTTVPIHHTPSNPIQLDRVMFHPDNGDFNKMTHFLIEAIKEKFTETEGITLVDRDNLKEMMDEQDFTNSGNVDGSQAIEIGRMKGASTLVVVKVLGVTPIKKEWQEPSGNLFIRTTACKFQASIKFVDIASGEVLSTKKATVTPTKRNSMVQIWPEYPNYEALSLDAVAQAADDITHTYLPWVEMREITFFDGGKYNMNNAFMALQDNDPEFALTLTKEGLEEAESNHAKTKIKARIYHNLSILRFVVGDYEGALQYIDKSIELSPKSSILRETKLAIRKSYRTEVDSPGDAAATE